MATLNELNAARVINGKTPLKVWKASKAALAAALDKECENSHGKAITPEQVEKAGLMTETPTTPTSVPTKSIKTSKSEGVSISEIAKSLGMNDKVARAKLRRRTDVPRLEGKAWSFAEKDVAKVKEILRQDNRKKGGAA